MPVFKSSRKVQLFGSSLALTLPALFVKACEIRKGAEMGVLFGLDGVLVVSDVMEPEALRDGLLLILKDLEEKVRRGKGKEGNTLTLGLEERKHKIEFKISENGEKRKFKSSTTWGLR